MPHLALLALGAGYTVFEWWLGKTDRVKANSSIELGFKIIRVAGAFFLRGKLK